ncbi:hypothetical protein MASR1M45_25520 [Candidatus Kapaibacterium sp.]
MRTDIQPQDEGQSDDQLAKLKYYLCKVELGDFIVVKQSTQQEIHFEYPSLSSTSYFENGPGELDTVFVKWNGTKFSMNRAFKDSIQYDNISVKSTSKLGFAAI